MDKNEPDWGLYRSFLHVMREGSLSGAARTLHLTQPTVGRQIDALEVALAVKLFTRSLDGLAPTEAALRLRDSAEAMSSLSTSMLRTVTATAAEARGTVRITASEIIGVEVLPAILADLRSAHPGLAIELALSNRNEDILHGAADIAVRMERPRQDSVVAKRLGAVKLGLFAHREYLKKYGTPKSFADLARHALIGFDRDPAFLQLVQSWGINISREDFAFRSDNDHAQIAALRAGIGIGICQAGIAMRDPNLRPLLANKMKFSLDMWLAVHRDMRGERRIRIVFDHLAKALSEYANLNGPSARTAL
jgi:DNA-binding transcriptional LysR family regulator